MIDISKYFDENNDDTLLPMKLEALWENYLQPWHKYGMIAQGLPPEQYEAWVQDNPNMMTLRNDLMRAAQLLRQLLGDEVERELKELFGEEDS